MGSPYNVSWFCLFIDLDKQFKKNVNENGYSYKLF